MKFVLYNPSRVIGGAEYLFYRLYKSLRLHGVDCRVVDYEDGAFLTLGGKLEDLIVIDSVYEKRIIECDCFLLPPNFSYDALYSITLNAYSKIIFWSIHPLNCVPSLPISYYKRLPANSLFKRFLDFIFLRGQELFAKRLFTEASAKKAIFFMDCENHITAARFVGPHLNNILLPIPVPEITRWCDVRSAQKNAGEEYNIFWIGRLVDFKVGALNRLIVDLGEWSVLEGRNVSIFIVGSGDKSSSVIESRHVKLVKLGHVENSKLHDLIIDKADAVFGMGTSILESGALGIPSFIVMPTYSEVGHVRSYVPLPDTKNYNLGSFSSEAEAVSFQQLNLEALLQSDRFGKACADYVVSNHGLDYVRNQIVLLGGQSNLFYFEIEKSFKKFFVIRWLYSFLKGR
jgi:hypothetical protein